MLSTTSQYALRALVRLGGVEAAPTLIERLAELLNARKLPLLADLRDESTEDIRVVLVPRSRGVPPELVMEQLFRQSELETRLNLNMNVLDAQGVPRVMGLPELLQAFIDHRMEVLVRGSRFRLAKIDDTLQQTIPAVGVWLTRYNDVIKNGPWGKIWRRSGETVPRGFIANR